MKTELLEADAAGIATAVAVWLGGGLVAFPTETVYGLGADARSASAVASIFVAKGRPAHNPLIVHVADLEEARRYAVVDERAERLAAAFWPGPLTMVLPKRVDSGLAPTVTAGLETVAVRAPAHPVAQQLLRAFAGPVAAPSANASGTLSPTLGAHVAASLGGRIPLVLEGGPSQVGLESTIVDLSGAGPVLLRRGVVTRARLTAVLGEVALSEGNPDLPSAPGQLLRHYAPSHPLRLDAETCEPGDAWLGFGPVAAPICAATLNLSPAGDLDEAAANLFAYLRQLDAEDVAQIVVTAIPSDGVGEAIRDRLRRAARG
ncbi:MAG: threonylcarbamoyl-AMP synthase [Proteobacteria bacterium]|nr:threonylcarbamoyl-AMP synthase [Pseudomonadota bacterium]